MIGRCLLLAGWLAVPSAAQFSGLSTTGDGATLYFSTPFRQAGTDQPRWPKLFIADEQGIRLYLQRDILTWTANPNGTRTSNPYNVVDPQVSDDGSVVAFTSYSVCTGGGSGCIGRSSRYAEVTAPAGTGAWGSGGASLSRNGRFLLRVPNSFELGEPVLLDRVSGDSATLPSRPLPGRRGITDDGAILLPARNGRQLLLWRGWGTQDPIPIAETDGSFGEAQVDAGGSTVALVEYTIQDGGSNWYLDAVDLAGRWRTRLVGGRFDQLSPTDPRAVRLSLSSDGRTVLFTAPLDQTMQLFVALTDGSSVRQLRAGDIADAVLSGDAKVAYAATTGNGLLRVDVASGEVRTLIEHTARVNYSGSILSRGSYARITGSGFLPEGRNVPGGPPFPRSFAGLQLAIGGVLAPILSVSATEIAWQVPWEAMTIDTLEVRQEGAAFEQGPIEYLCCSIAWPQFLTPPAHEGFDAPVTRERPARASEVVHFYMTGLGAVSPEVPSGEVSPVNSPARILEPLTVLVDNTPAEVLFAGLAPGLVGVYQVDVRLPGELAAGHAEVLAHLTARFPQAWTVLPTSP